MRLRLKIFLANYVPEWIHVSEKFLGKMNTNQLIRFDQKDGFYNAYDCITTMQNRLKLFSIVKASLFYSWIKLIFSKKVQGSRERERHRFSTDFYYNVCKQTIYFRLITRCFNISSIKPNMTLNKSTFIADTTAQK